MPARRLPSCPACSVLPRSTPVRCHIPRRWAGWRSGLVDASDAEVIHVGETWAARAFRNCPSSGVCPAAGVVWVSVGARVETWAAPVWVVVGVRETWASRACFMAPDMGSFGEAGVVWVSRGGACVKTGPPLSSETAPKTVRILQRGWSGFQRERGLKPGPPVPVSWRLIWGVLAKRGWSGFRGGVRGVKQGWSGFQRGRGLKPGPPLCGLLWACVKPGPPVPVPWRLIWGVLAKQGWPGFQRGRGYETGSAPAFRNCPSSGACPAAGVVWVSRASPTAPSVRANRAPPVAHGSTRIRPAARWAESPPTGRWAGRAGPRSPAPARCHSRAERPRRPETRR